MILVLATLAGCSEPPVYERQIVCTMQDAAFMSHVRHWLLRYWPLDSGVTLSRAPDADRLCAPLKGLKGDENGKTS